MKERNMRSTKRKAGGGSQSNDNLRRLQITKVVRKFLPTTVNGAGRVTIVKRVFERHPAEFPNPIDDVDRLSKKALCEYIKYYVSDFMADHPKESIHMTFDLKLDPDFPFDLENLKVDLCVPVGRQAPLILVLSLEVPRGFAANVERGFRAITAIALRKSPESEEIKLVLGNGLLSQLQTLIKYLEYFLQQEKRPEVKIVKRASAANHDSLSRTALTPETSPASSLASSKAKTSRKTVPSAESFVSESDKFERSRQLDELQHKLSSSVKLFRKTSLVDQFKITLPLSIGLLDIPALWSYNKGVEIMMTVPEVWPPESNVPIGSDMLKISLGSNFHNNTLLRYRKESNAQIDLLKAAKDYKELEATFIRNLRQLEFPLRSLLGVANTVKNHLCILSQRSDIFSEWQRNVINFEATSLEV